MSWQVIGLFLVAFIAIFWGITYIYRQIYQERLAITSQIEKMKKQSKEIYKIELPVHNKESAKLPFLMALERKLIAADIALTAQEALMLYGMLVFFPGMCCYAATSNIFFGLLLAVAAAAFPLLFVRVRIKKQQKAFDEQLGDVLTIIANSMRMGFSFLQSMSNLSKEVADPIGRELRRVVKDIDLGMTQEAALLNLEERMNSRELRLVNSALNIQRRTGGNLADMLDNLSETILNRQKVVREINVVTSQGRISSKVIGLLPVGLFLMIMGVNSAYILDFLKEPIGVITVCAGFIMDIIGFLVIRSMVNIKY